MTLFLLFSLMSPKWDNQILARYLLTEVYKSDVFMIYTSWCMIKHLDIVLFWKLISHALHTSSELHQWTTIFSISTCFVQRLVLDTNLFLLGVSHPWDSPISILRWSSIRDMKNVCQVGYIY